MKQKFLLVFGVIVILVGGATIYFLKTNTALLSGDNQNTPQVTPTIFSLKPLQFEQTVLEVQNKWQLGVLKSDRVLTVPSGLKVKVFYAGLNAPRGMDFDDDSNLYVAERGAGQIIKLVDADQDGVAEQKLIIDQNLSKPHGIDYYNGDLYVGESDQIVVYKNIDVHGSKAVKQIIVDDLADNGHYTKTVLIGPDQKLYMANGSSCNLCEEDNPLRATISRYNLDGSGQEIYASGLRNTVGMVFSLDAATLQYQLWTVDNGRDLLGDDLPPEEVNLISLGKNYGWPYCYGDGINNPEYPKRQQYCKTQTESPAISMQAHSAPLGISFIPKNSALYQYLGEKILVSFHGSWNRSQKTGYKIVVVDPKRPELKDQDLITGWLNGNQVWGRPVDIKFDELGAMYVSDDSNGAIYQFK